MRPRTVPLATLLAVVLLSCASADIPPSGRRIEVRARLANLAEHPDYLFLVRSHSFNGVAYSRVSGDGHLDGPPRSREWTLLALKKATLSLPAHAALVAALERGHARPQREGADALMKLADGPEFLVCEEPVAWYAEYTEDSSNDAQSIEREYRVGALGGRKLKVYLARETRVRPGGTAEVKEFPNPFQEAPAPAR